MSDESLDMFLLGKTGHGKSSTGNSLLGREAFHVSDSAQSDTFAIQCGWARRQGRKIKVTNIFVFSTSIVWVECVLFFIRNGSHLCFNICVNNNVTTLTLNMLQINYMVAVVWQCYNYVISEADLQANLKKEVNSGKPCMRVNKLMI